MNPQTASMDAEWIIYAMGTMYGGEISANVSHPLSPTSHVADREVDIRELST